MTDFQSQSDVINKGFASVDNYLKSDSRLEKRKDLLGPKIDVKMFDKLINAAKGVRNFYTVNIRGTDVPLRLLSLAEMRQIKHETHLEFKKYPEFRGGENHPEFSRIELIKTISRATSACPEEYDIKQPNPFFTEHEVESMDEPSFNFLLKKYQVLLKEYDITYNEDFEEEINDIIFYLFDGGDLSEKKLALLTGLTSQQLLQITIRFYNVVTRLEDNARFITLLEESNQKKDEENLTD